METTSSPTLLENSNKIYTTEIIVWIVLDTVLMIAILAGNMLTLCAIRLSRKISVIVSNQFIFNLALSDLMVGLTLPYHLAFYIDMDPFGKNKNTCILRFVLIILACSSSILNLLAIAADRYIAIVHPLSYNRFMTKRAAIIIISTSWLMCFAVATVPIYWNVWADNYTCWIEVLPEQYLNFIVTPMFVSIWIAMYIVYFRICREAADHAKRMRQTAFCQNEAAASDSKSVQVVLLILGCFSVCWLPYFVVVIYIRATGIEASLVYEAAFTMAATNSCMNPVIYAWKNANFREAFWRILRCKRINTLSQDQDYITNHVPGTAKNSIVNGNTQNHLQETVIDRNDIELYTVKSEVAKQRQPTLIC